MAHPGTNTTKVYSVKQGGFSLLEVAIVLAIMTMLFAATLPLLSAQRTNAQIEATRTKLTAAKAALANFISRNNRLPCPAVGGLPSTDPSYGREATVPGTCTGTVNAGGTPVAGILPWRDLGLSDEATQDGVYLRFTYQVTSQATNLFPDNTGVGQRISGMQGNMNIYSSGLPGPPLSANQINVGRLAVAVMLSHGTNGFGAWHPESGTRNALPPGGAIDETENTNDDLSFVQKNYSADDTNPFDDIVLWLTPDDLISPLVRAGTVKSATAAMNDRVEIIKAAIMAYALTNRSCPGTPPPPVCVYPLPTPTVFTTTVLPTIPTYAQSDLWNTGFAYTQGVASIGSATPPGSAFTLTSAGVDGVSGTPDDTTAVTVAELQGIFAKTGF
jgi:prepilin-type N-terminal cleavage/methylation domain-containing protein